MTEFTVHFDLSGFISLDQSGESVPEELNVATVDNWRLFHFQNHLLILGKSAVKNAVTFYEREMQQVWQYSISEFVCRLRTQMCPNFSSLWCFTDFSKRDLIFRQFITGPGYWIDQFLSGHQELKLLACEKFILSNKSIAKEGPILQQTLLIFDEAINSSMNKLSEKTAHDYDLLMVMKFYKSQWKVLTGVIF